MSSRNLPVYRHSYIEPHLTDDESSESIASYLDDLNARKNNRDKRDSAGRSIRSSRQSSKSSPHHSFDEDSEGFTRSRSYRHARERRANSLASSRAERRPSRIRSDSTQDSETEIGTRALVQAKIREKVARAESMDESSSDLWKPKSTTPAKLEPIEKDVKVEVSASKSAETIQTPAKANDKPVKIVPKTASERRKSVERIVKPKPSTEAQTTPNTTKKPMAKSTTTKISNGAKSAEKIEPVKKSESSEVDAEVAEVSEKDLAKLPDSVPEGPPKIPEYEWTCEYCTFENEANVRICAVCCKTPSAAAIRKQSSAANEKNPQLNGTNGTHNDSASVAKEGRGKRISRKISFWPGTKPK